VGELIEFARIVLLASAGLLVAVLSSTVTERLRIPAPILFLALASVTSDWFDRLETIFSPVDVARIGTVCLIVILFEGGMQVGWKDFRGSLGPIALLGVPGTFLTAAVLALAAHFALGMGWTTAWLIAAALSPTDPAVIFSLLGNREVGGRSGTILKGESGMNDPVSIALMVGMLQIATDHGGVVGPGGSFVLEMVVGLLVGAVGGRLILLMVRRLPPGGEAFSPLRLLAAAGIVYGLATVLHGSGFIAVFVAGILLGDERFPYKVATESFLAPAAGLAEVTMFVVLGLTVDITSFLSRVWLDGILIALLLVLVARPLVVAALLHWADLRPGERAFISWAGMKGAVPILLGSFAVEAHVHEAQRIYGIVFVVVAVTVLVQGIGLETVAERLGIPLRPVEPEPWSVSIGLREEPSNLARFVVAEEAAAAGVALRDLPLDRRSWVTLIVREGRVVPARGSRVLEPGDELIVMSRPEDRDGLRLLLEG
jgi:cell volume regulation protein A